VPQLTAASDHSLLVSFAEEVSLEVHRQVLRLTLLLETTRHVVNIHPGYCTLLVSFDPRQAPRERIEGLVRDALDRLDTVMLPAARTIEVPVRYGGDDGPDLADVAGLHGMSAEDVVRLHAAPEYLVYFLGFSPGFPYLGGMDPAIATPRLSMPRTRVAAGSVAIGGEHTGVYPVASPGGWRIIGRTPLNIFEPQRDPPVLLRMGDHVRFIPLRD
jgi:KipI family sensor histidine kinase inhibitor